MVNRTCVIAECGSTHDGDSDRAVRLIAAAKDAGCDAAKVQFWSDADALADRRQVPSHYREVYRRYQVPVRWLDRLSMIASVENIELIASVYVAGDVEIVGPYVRRLKISSFEAADRYLLRECQFHGPTIVSTGMHSDDEWRALLRLLRAEDACLHCVSSYPADPAQMNLRALWTHAAFRAADCCGHDDWRPIPGLSDHSRDVHMGALAVAAGAEIIEAHLRLDDTDPQNPDYAVAFTPDEFAEYVRLIRRAETIMGSGEKTLQECEQPMAAYRVQSNRGS